MIDKIFQYINMRFNSVCEFGAVVFIILGVVVTIVMLYRSTGGNDR